MDDITEKLVYHIDVFPKIMYILSSFLWDRIHGYDYL